jgi:hypothetical protein
VATEHGSANGKSPVSVTICGHVGPSTWSIVSNLLLMTTYVKIFRGSLPLFILELLPSEGLATSESGIKT